jgi:hypothetical protein
MDRGREEERRSGMTRNEGTELRRSRTASSAERGQGKGKRE